MCTRLAAGLPFRSAYALAIYLSAHSQKNFRPGRRIDEKSKSIPRRRAARRARSGGGGICRAVGSSVKSRIRHARQQGERKKAQKRPGFRRLGSKAVTTASRTLSTEPHMTALNSHRRLPFLLPLPAHGDHPGRLAHYARAGSVAPAQETAVPDTSSEDGGFSQQEEPRVGETDDRVGPSITPLFRYGRRITLRQQLRSGIRCRPTPCPSRSKGNPFTKGSTFSRGSPSTTRRGMRVCPASVG